MVTMVTPLWRCVRESRSYYVMFCARSTMFLSTLIIYTSDQGIRESDVYNHKT